MSLQDDLNFESSDLSTKLNELRLELDVRGNKTMEKDMELMSDISYIETKVESLTVGLENTNQDVAYNNKSISDLSQRLSNEKSSLLEVIGDLQTQLDMNHNKTSKKGMTLMDQISDLNQQIARIDLDAADEAEKRLEGDRVTADLMRVVETDLLRQIQEHRKDTTNMENHWSDQGSK